MVSSKRPEVEKERRNESKAITKFFRPHAISKPERKEIDEAVIDYFIARSEPFRAVEDHFFRQMVYRMHRGYSLLSEMELARKIDAKIEQKPLLTIALKILKTIEKPLVSMVGPPQKHSMVMVHLCQNH